MSKQTIKRTPIFFLLLLASVCAAAQDIEQVKAKYPGENAVVLEKNLQYKIEVKDGQPYVESRELQKILYLNTNSSVLSRFSFHHSSFNELKGYAAYTQTSAKKKIMVTDFQTSNSNSNSVFYDDTKETRFDFPSLAPGATGNLEVSRIHTKPYLLSPFYLSAYVPVLKAQLSISVSNDIGLKYIVKGYDTSMIRITRDKKRNETVYTFSAVDLAADNRYGDAPDESWYAPHVIFYIDHFINEKGEKKNYLSGIDDLYKLNYSFIKDVNRSPNQELQSLVDSLTKGVNDPLESTKRVYRWVQQHIKYIAFEDGMSGFVPRDANLVLHRRYGDCKDMASLLTMMLNAAGIPAYYTWIGTRDIAYSYHEVPLPIVDNHMICTAFPSGKMIFLDGTDPHCEFGTAPSAIQDKEALVAISESEYKIVKVPVRSGAENAIVDSTDIQLNNNQLEGSIKIDLYGYYASDMNSFLKNVPKRDLEERVKGRFERGSNKLILTGYSIDESQEKNRLTLKGQFTLADYAKHAGDEWFVNLNLTRIFENEEIDYPNRKMPVENDFYWRTRHVVSLKIPDGYTVSYLPESRSFRNDVWGFDLKYEVKDGYVYYTVDLADDHLMIGVDQFQQWNKVLEYLTPLYKEIVILSKE